MPFDRNPLHQAHLYGRRADLPKLLQQRSFVPSSGNLIQGEARATFRSKCSVAQSVTLWALPSSFYPPPTSSVRLAPAASPISSLQQRCRSGEGGLKYEQLESPCRARQFRAASVARGRIPFPGGRDSDLEPLARAMVIAATRQRRQRSPA